MTENPHHEQLDITAKASVSNRNSTGDRNDIVGRTSFLLPSFSGLEQSPLVLPSVEQARDPTVPLELEEQLPGTQPVLGKSESGKSKLSRNKVRLRPYMLIVLLCIVALGAFMLGYTHSTTPVNRLVIPNNYISQQQQSGNPAPGTRSYQVGEHVFVAIKGFGGNIHIFAGSAGTVIVKANSNESSQGEISTNQGVRYAQSHDGQGHDYISIETEPPYKNINYDVTMPQTARVNVQVDSGSIAVEGVSGVTITTSSGNLDIENVNGPVNVSTESGDIIARGLNGQTDIQTVNGSIRANNLNGQLNAITQNGDVIVRQAGLNGQSVLKTMYGSVRFTGTLDPMGTYTMETSSGNVDLVLPANAAFQLRAHTDSGAINNEFGANTSNSSPQAQIIVNIGSGSVKVSEG